MLILAASEKRTAVISPFVRLRRRLVLPLLAALGAARAWGGHDPANWNQYTAKETESFRLELFSGAAEGDNTSVRCMTSCGPDAPDPNGVTALIIAAQKGKLNAMRALLNYGADPNTVTKNGYTPLKAAVISAPRRSDCSMLTGPTHS
ncbi:MAG: ankyrin repeat domain-containing protein [Lacunisphaera sp.]